MLPKGLGRQISLSMAVGAIMGVIVTYLGFYIYFAILIFFFPASTPAEDTWLPTSGDMVALALVAVVALMGATALAMRLAKRIVTPLNSVALAARRIAEGDLGARAQRGGGAQAGDPPSDETTLLVDDFNAMAVRLEKAASDVVTWNAQIAHELRTPLTVLHGRLQGLIDGVFVPDEALFRRLLGQVDALSRLVEDLRVVSLVDSGHLELQPVDVDLAAEIEDFAELVEPSLQRAGFALATRLDAGRACLDVTRIRQALLALIDNAMRHANPGALRIELSLDEASVVLRVIDEGPGLPPEFALDAFELFSHPDGVHRGGAAGSGLGLSVVRAIARAHGGEASYREQDGGSAFIIALPRDIGARRR